MREILFRGKVKSALNVDEWVYGFLVNTRSRFNGELRTYIQTIKENGELDLLRAVDPQTVGQYTGLTDKNGTKIFEGDVLRIAKRMDGMGGYYYPPLEYPVNVVVKWDMCAWLWETLCKDKRYIHFPDAWCHYECEVIGNIHDNPELLKGGD